MPALLRHVAAIPTDREQRCLRCCEVIARPGPLMRMCAWPGSKILVIGGRLVADHTAATDCAAVDLSKKEEADAPGGPDAGAK